MTYQPHQSEDRIDIAGTRLDELDKTEMWDVCRALRPDITEPEFEAKWAEFCQLKAEHERKKALH